MKIKLLLLLIGSPLVLQTVNPQIPIFARVPGIQIFPEGDQLNLLISPVTLNKNQIKVIVKGRSLKVLNLTVSPESDRYIFREQLLPSYVMATSDTNATLTGNTLAIINMQKTDNANEFELNVQ